jgi:DNA polymerase-1
MCRSFFVPEEGETWYSLDYSNQEGRLQVHYAVLLDCKGADLVQKEFLRDPNFDLHQWVADLCGIARFDGKTINLGISYGMALNSLGQSLSVSRAEAKRLKGLYNKQMPYLSDLATKCEGIMKDKGRIKTLGGRLLRREDGFEYKTLNKLIQGSASDQTVEAMIQAYKRGIPVLFPVHDELNLSTSNPQDAYDLQALMTIAYELVIPTVVSIGSGENWGECK